MSKDKATREELDAKFAPYKPEKKGNSKSPLADPMNYVIGGIVLFLFVTACNYHDRDFSITMTFLFSVAVAGFFRYMNRHHVKAYLDDQKARFGK